MSIKALAWAYDQEVFPSSHRFVLITLSNFASEGGKTYPSLETICRKTALQEKTARAALDNLVQLGYIKDTGQKVGITQRVKVFQLPDEACEMQAISPLFNGGGNTGRNQGEIQAKSRRKGRVEAGTGSRDPLKKKEGASRFDLIPNLPADLKDTKLTEVWTAFCLERRLKKKLVTPRAAELIFKDYRKWGVEKSIEFTELSIKNGWLGIFEKEGRGGRQGQNNKPIRSPYASPGDDNDLRGCYGA